MDLFEIRNLVSVGMASVTDLYSSLGGQSERVTELERLDQ